jgi:hypothetical protein
MDPKEALRVLTGREADEPQGPRIKVYAAEGDDRVVAMLFECREDRDEFLRDLGIELSPRKLQLVIPISMN